MCSILVPYLICCLVTGYLVSLFPKKFTSVVLFLLEAEEIDKNYICFVVMYQSPVLNQCNVGLYIKCFRVLKINKVQVQLYNSAWSWLCAMGSDPPKTEWIPLQVSFWQDQGREASSWPGNCTAFETRYWIFSHLFAVSRLVSPSAGGFLLI